MANTLRGPSLRDLYERKMESQIAANQSIGNSVGGYLRNVATGEYAKRGLRDLENLARRAIDPRDTQAALDIALQFSPGAALSTKIGKLPTWGDLKSAIKGDDGKVYVAKPWQHHGDVHESVYERGLTSIEPGQPAHDITGWKYDDLFISVRDMDEAMGDLDKAISIALSRISNR